MRDQFIKELEFLFEKALATEKLTVALKTKELLAKLYGWLGKEKKQRIPPLTQWSEEELQKMLASLEEPILEESDIDLPQKI